jgi:NADH-quinone oxidoreductase subunit J
MMIWCMMQTRETPYNFQWLFGAVTGLAVFLLFGLVIVQTWGVTDVSFIQASEAELNNKVIEMGQALVSADQFVLPFELASVLLLAALIGSIVVALPESKS